MFLNILLALGLVIAFIWAFSGKVSSEQNDSPSGSSTYEDIMTRTSVRAYSDRPVSDEMVDSLLRAAMAAPTAGNKQPWRFVVIRDTVALNYIADNFDSMKMMRRAKVAVVVCGDTTATFSGAGVDYWIQDTSAATENLLLAAHSFGLGAVWCGVYPIPERVADFSRILLLPGEILPLNCIAIGYPEGESAPKDKWKPEYIHYDVW